MSVVIETTIGDITVDLYLKERPNTCLNFLKLCKMKYYNFCLFHKVERNFIAQTGDPTATGRGGESIFSTLYGAQAKYFDAELKPRMKHEKIGTLSMVNNGGNMNGSQFFLTLGENLTYLDEVHTVFGEVAEGLEVLLKINETICDQNDRPYQDIRITHTVILHDPYEDPAGLSVPDASPEPTKEMLETDYIAPDEELDDTKGKDIEEIEEKIKDSEAKARATILEMVGDIPDAEVKPPENVLFVCKLNPVTTSEDLELIFSRFGTIVSCEVIKDKKSGESLQYAFIEFEKEEDCENAYFKMDNVLIDDRRIHVDFSQSVAKLNWNQNKVGKGKPGRFQNFVLKSDVKKSDGYEMIFDTNDDTYPQSSRGKNRHQERSRNMESYRSSNKSYEDKYSSKSHGVQLSEKSHKKHKSRRSRSPSESSYNFKEHHSRLSRKSPSIQSRFHHNSSSFSKTSDYPSIKKTSRQKSYSSDSSSSPARTNQSTRYKEKYSKDQHYQKSKQSYEKSQSSDSRDQHHKKPKNSYEKPQSNDKTKTKSYDSSARYISSNDSKHDYRSKRSISPLPKKRKNRSSSSDEESYSKSHGSSNFKLKQSSKSHSKSSISKCRQKTSDSSSSSDEYVSKKNSEPKRRNYEDPPKHSSRKKSPSFQYSKSNRKSSPTRHKDKTSKHSKNDKYDRSSSDSESYLSKSKLNSSNYKLSHKSKHRRRSSS
ncbi:peptidyl-prolyl cis-trans isomerase sig-7 [Parasteatoda tepidariorum]|uniref:peptidyl-prolyl cis-trans isomerase sig-7 n=1 Tax=Parasteatoda tepidariorum TaxID=114398 RepID=UPI001C7262A4|nr:peptidyl-prolyl cis-trans isomerase sig-7 [Parasteatoda tepidariorum]XP_015930464.2 peptidyl-prolyl cis-trans isomerase sig-7 [Parasteatoda tepidariorum]XP_015930465.2 peptidyl-prolyl cis-trans isomerase sig-7 [Parasteatoda tepidariorum]XP_042900747.1 peptidyl-prolyl cis-trans isomerase sig-7 [Parasteatoda tepidariorum]XP_042900748.1 peptidyl-prolyl cis-trans isomerase sig-7 [Parasteatoda tepidariorum]XP_042900749.1 peptidyl-prolyl cis-trans isomerase sig-7 [Parasteatoda tepidariorum]XP_04